jgi:ABC-type dipeptide/oligopeptide/nickel transport system permease component
VARFALTRSASLVGILLGLSVVVFLLEAVVPADPVRAMVGAAPLPYPPVGDAGERVGAGQPLQPADQAADLGTLSYP